MNDLEQFMEDMLFNEPKKYLSKEAYEVWLEELKDYREWFRKTYPRSEIK